MEEIVPADRPSSSTRPPPQRRMALAEPFIARSSLRPLSPRSGHSSASPTTSRASPLVLHISAVSMLVKGGTEWILIKWTWCLAIKTSLLQCLEKPASNLEKFCFSPYMIVVIIYLMANVTGIILFFAPAVCSFIETSNWEACNVLSWWAQVFPKNSPLAEDFSKAILQLSDNGTLSYLEDKWFSQSLVSCPDKCKSNTRENLDLGSLWMLLPLPQSFLPVFKVQFVPCNSRRYLAVASGPRVQRCAGLGCYKCGTGSGLQVSHNSDISSTRMAPETCSCRGTSLCTH